MKRRVPEDLTIKSGTTLDRDPLKRFRLDYKGTHLTKTSSLKPLERSCRRWQLLMLQWFFYESHYPLDMHLGRRNLRQSQVTPGFDEDLNPPIR